MSKQMKTHVGMQTISSSGDYIADFCTCLVRAYWSESVNTSTLWDGVADIGVSYDFAIGLWLLHVFGLHL